MLRTVDVDRWRWDVEAASPQLRLFRAMSIRRLLLVEALQRAVVAFVEPPVTLHRQPDLTHHLECEIARHHGAVEHRGVGDVEPQPGVGHRLAGRGAFGPALVVEWHVVPSREQVELVPRAFAVTEDDESAGHRLMVGGDNPRTRTP